MPLALRTIVHPVTDLAAAKAVYGALLGVAPQVDQPYYVGYEVGDLHVGLDPNGHAQGSTAPVGYWQVDDLEATIERMVAAGARVRQPAREVGGGRRIATLEDADGNVIGVLQDPAS